MVMVVGVGTYLGVLWWQGCVVVVVVVDGGEGGLRVEAVAACFPHLPWA